ncbi:MAG: hypothetical protein QM772_00065 [Ottowia sp.]|uniref:hypothetical protein n=1 Tax=Ottowia sp. TaxID=1898956 RepID=UPI0039E3FC29
MHGQGVWAELLRQRFATACRRLGLAGERNGLTLARPNPGGAAGTGRAVWPQR